MHAQPRMFSTPIGASTFPPACGFASEVLTTCAMLWWNSRRLSIMHASSFALVFLLLQSSLQLSGNFSGEDDDEEPENELQPDFECFSKISMRLIRLLCSVKNVPLRKGKNFKFTVQDGSRRLSESWRENENVVFHLQLQEYNVCLVWGKSSRCRPVDLQKVAIPDSPSNLNIKYNRNSKEYKFNIFVKYEMYDYLIGKVEHELVIRNEGTPWPRCENETDDSQGHKVCFKTIQDDLYVPRRNLNYSTTYEARVRSKPTGGFYDGFWSPWSAITTFKTQENENATVSDNGAFLVSYISIPFFLVVTVILIAIFWKRIKPFIWPEIPDHKKTLEKFCKKPKQDFHISFNPDYYEIIPINKIDYIKAQEIPEDEYDIGTVDSSMGKSSVNAWQTNLFPAGGSRGTPSNTNSSGQCKNLSDDGENPLEKPLHFGAITVLSNEDISEKCNPSTDSNGIISVAEKQPENGLKGLCWEDIYIAMSAFKTPSSAVKQVPNNTF